MKEIEEMLFANKDEKFKLFQERLIPSVSKETIIGVRTPVLRQIAKEVFNSGLKNDFLDSVPHFYFEENQVHAFVVEQIRDFDECVFRLNQFLPYIDNWATCDQCSPRVFKKNLEKLLPEIDAWLAAKDSDGSCWEYTVRFAIGLLMRFFLDDEFRPGFLKNVAEIKSEKYYVNMMIAWYFATALAKQWDSAFEYVRDKEKLNEWVRKKTIQKALESFRITAEQKEILRNIK